MTQTPMMTAPAGPAGVVTASRESLQTLSDVLWAARRPEELLETLRGLERLRSTLDAVELAVIAEVEATDAAATEGWASTKDYVTAVSGGRKSSGPTLVRLARSLTGGCRATAAALAEGSISRDQAKVIADAVEMLPSKPSLRAEAEAALLTHAATCDASQLTKVAAHLIEIVDPDGHDRREERRLARLERAAHHHRFLAITEDGAGGVRITGRTTVESAAVIKAALWPLAAPVTTPAGSCGGAENCRDRHCRHDGRDARDHGARFLDALVEGCQRLLDSQTLPTSHGMKPRLNITIPLSDLTEGLGDGLLDTGQDLPADVVRRLACDADVIPTVLGTLGQVLDVGRAHRLVTKALWDALVVRDAHCAFPGCRRPPIACDAHHIVHWTDGGPTSLGNLVLLCRAHHKQIHNTPWEVRINPIDEKPEFLPPSRLDPDRRPIRERSPRA